MAFESGAHPGVCGYLFLRTEQRGQGQHGVAISRCLRSSEETVPFMTPKLIDHVGLLNGPPSDRVVCIGP